MDLLTELALNRLAAESRKQAHVRHAPQALKFSPKEIFTSLLAQLARGEEDPPRELAMKSPHLPPNTAEN